ncbi:MAG: fibronectin type III domain-containing protein, partial [Fibrobacteres bacterium]|nr:fibronectin type III domain-containing protein [Fibrobacterota bacterium]
SGTTYIRNNNFDSDSIIVSSGTLNLGTNNDFTTGTLTGNGNLVFNNNNIRIFEDAQFANFGTITSTPSDTIFFSASTGFQYLSPKASVTLPVISHDSNSTLYISGSNLTANSLLNYDGALDFGNKNVTALSEIKIVNGNNGTVQNLAACTLSASRIDLRGNAGDLLNLNPASTWWIDGTVVAEARYAIVGKSNASLGVEGTPVSCVDSMGNVNWGFNEAPAIGDTSLFVLPSYRIKQALDGSGLVTVYFRVIDQDSNRVRLLDFQYSPDSGATWYAPVNGDSSDALGINWPDSNGIKFPSKKNYTGRINTFTFNTRHADVRNIYSLDSADMRVFRLRFNAHDGRVLSTQAGVSEATVLDNKPPVPLASIALQSGYPSADSTQFVMAASFTETRPVSTEWNYRLNGAAYGAPIPGTDYTSSPAPLTVSLQLTSRDSLNALKISCRDSLGNVGISETIIPYYVKPKRPDRPILIVSDSAILKLAVDSANGEVAALEYSIQVDSSGNYTYVQSDGTRGALPVWQNTLTWDTVALSSLALPYSSYLFRVKSRHLYNHLIESDYSVAASNVPVPPLVKTIEASQRRDGLDTADIYFRVYDPDNVSLNITVQYKLGESGLWNSAAGALLISSYPSTDSTTIHSVKWAIASDFDSLHSSDSTFIRIVATDPDLSRDTLDSGIFVTDRLIPASINNFSSMPLSPSEVVLNWDASVDIDADSIMVRYSLDTLPVPVSITEGLLNGTFTVSRLTDTIKGLESDIKINASIFVKDSMGHWSTPSIVSDTTLDTIKPLTVSSFIATPIAAGDIALSWTPSLSADADSLVIRYRLDSIAPVNSTDGLFWKILSAVSTLDTIKGLLSDTRYDIALFVKDVHGNYSSPVSDSVVTLDTLRPLAITSFILASNSPGSFALSWTPSTSYDADSVMIRFDTVSVPITSSNGILHKMLSAATELDTINDLVSDKKYYVSVFVKDIHDNWSYPVYDSAFTIDTISPNPVDSLVASALGPQSILLSWSPSIAYDADSIIIRYKTDSIAPVSETDGIFWKTIANSANIDTITGLLSDRRYDISLFVKDVHGNYSDRTYTYINTLDTIIPEPVTSFTLLSDSGGFFDLSWNPSLSNDADSVMIRYDTVSVPLSVSSGILHSLLANTANRDTIDNLISGKMYYVSMFVRDVNKNWSLPASDSAITIDTLSPNPVDSLVASAQGPRSILLSWSPSIAIDADSIIIRYRTDSIAPVSESDGQLWKSLSNSANFDTITGLVSDRRYDVSLFVKDLHGNYSEKTSAFATTLDTIIPEPITSLTINANS